MAEKLTDKQIELQKMLAGVEDAKSEAGRQIKDLLGEMVPQVLQNVPEKVWRYFVGEYDGSVIYSTVSVIGNNAGKLKNGDYGVLRTDGRMYRWIVERRRLGSSVPYDGCDYRYDQRLGDEISLPEYYEVGPRAIGYLCSLEERGRERFPDYDELPKINLQETPKNASGETC